MPTQSISNNYEIRSTEPVEPPNQSTAPMTADQFTHKIINYISEGIKNHFSQEYVARQIETLAKENPDLASQSGLSDYQIIKNGVEKAYQAGAHNRPLALTGTSDFDMLTWGVRTEADKRILPKPMTAEEQQSLRATGKQLLTLVTAATAVATGTYLLPVARTLAAYTAEELTIFAATPQGQQIAKDALDCLSSMINESPPPDTVKGVECYLANYFYDKVKDHEASK